MSDEKGDQGTVQIALRIAPDLRERIKAAADANNRSVNKELTATLEEKYPDPEFAAFEIVAEAVRRDGRPRSAIWLGERAILMLLPDGSFRVTTTNMPIDEYVKSVAKKRSASRALTRDGDEDKEPAS